MKIIISKFLIVYIGIFALIALLLTSCQNATADNGHSNRAQFIEALDELTKSVEDMSAIELAEAQLEALRDKKEYREYYGRLAAIDQDDLAKELDTDAKKLAFWVNIYNANIIITLSDAPSLYDDRGDFFKKDRVVIAGKNLSFDKIEHGIIRNSTLKLSKGYIRNPFPGDFEKKFRVQEKDPRIHFVLNCGAKDCPPVYVYNPNTLDEDFDHVAKKYLARVSKYDAAKDRVETTPLFQWFTGDWGGNSGVKDMLSKYQIIPANHEKTDVDYLGYDWTLDIDNFGGEPANHSTAFKE